MTTITVWLLVSIGTGTSYAFPPSSTIARFASLAECQRVANTISGTSTGNREQSPMRCIQATIVKE